MSLTRKFLTGMGLTAEQVDAIIDEHASTVDSLKEQRDSYKEDAEKASKILGITLTKSTKTKDEQGKPLVMAGFPL